MNYLAMGLVALAILATPLIAYTSWNAWHGFMSGDVHGYMHDHMGDHECYEEHGSEEITIAGTIVSKDHDSVTVSANDSIFVVQLRGYWLVNYGNDSKSVISYDELLSDHLRVNESIVIHGYLMKMGPNENIVMPEEITSSSGLTARIGEHMGTEDEEAGFEEDECPMMQGMHGMSHT